jgi:Flp pilus assembly protein TadD
MNLRRHGLFLTFILVSLGCATSPERARDEQSFHARKELTRQLVTRGEWASAFAYADEMHRQRPKDAEVLVLRGTIFRERNLLVDAEADLRAAVALDARSGEAHAALGILLDSSGRGTEAETHHRRSVELVPGSAAHLNNLGFSLLTRRKHKEALQVLQRAARLDPTGRRVRTNLGFAYAAMGDLPRAAGEFEMGASAAEAKNNLGFAYETRGDLGNAFELYAQALRVDPACVPARNNLAHVAGALKRPLPADLVAGPAAPVASPPSSSTNSSPQTDAQGEEGP